MSYYDEDRQYDPDECKSVSVSMKVKQWAKIDALRGSIPRSVYLRQLIDLALLEGLQYKIK